MKLSVIMPVFNEKDTILKILDKIKQVNIGNIQKEIIIVEGGSTDGSDKIVDGVQDQKNVFCYHINHYCGKGYKVRYGLKKATGDIILIQDADLEYNPEDIPTLIKPILEGKTKVVYGSRGLKPNEYSYYTYFLGNKLLTFATNILFGSKITDVETCYKVFTKEIIQGIPLKADGFDLDPEITAKILRREEKIIELPINYKPRNLEEGKKIKWKDGVYALWILLKYRFSE